MANNAQGAQLCRENGLKPSESRLRGAVANPRPGHGTVPCWPQIYAQLSELPDPRVVYPQAIAVVCQAVEAGCHLPGLDEPAFSHLKIWREAAPAEKTTKRSCLDDHANAPKPGARYLQSPSNSLRTLFREKIFSGCRSRRFPSKKRELGPERFRPQCLRHAVNGRSVKQSRRRCWPPA